MRKIILILTMFVLFVQTQAQIINNDKNWDTIPYFYDGFDYPHTAWDTNTWIDAPDSLWKTTIATGVTHNLKTWVEPQVYNRRNVILNADSTLILRADTASPAGQRITNYEVPTDMTYKNLADTP